MHWPLTPRTGAVPLRLHAMMQSLCCSVAALVFVAGETSNVCIPGKCSWPANHG